MKKSIRLDAAGSARLSGCGHFESLESRQYLSNPSIVDFSASVAVVHAGDVITLRAHATDDTGVRAVVFWIEDNQDALNQFILNSFDQPLGDVFVPDGGSGNQYSIQVRVGASWTSSVKFGVDVVDVDGNYSHQPINFTTIQNLPKPFVLQMRAETLSGGDIHLIAVTSVDGERISGTGIAGVTFFVDQNGNNQWDAGTDVDLGTGTLTGTGTYEKTITPQGGWNLTWFTASAFDTRASSDKFGPNHSTVLRADDTPPRITVWDLIPPDNDTNAIVWSSNETVRFYMQFAGPQPAVSATFFYDRNQNGLWDAGIDTPLSQDLSGTIQSGYAAHFRLLGDLGHGWQSVGMAVHDVSGRGDDSWSAVTTAWINIDNTPWVTSPTLASTSIAQGTASIDLTFHVHDDDGVMGIRAAFIDVNGNTGYNAGEPVGTNLFLYSASRTDGIWRLTFDTHALAPGTYNIHLWLQDYREIWGPRTVVSFDVV